MDEGEPQFQEIGPAAAASPIAGARAIPTKRGSSGCSGFLSDMASTKALAVAEWAASARPPMLRFDYSGHGLSGGDFLDATIGDWLDEATAMCELMGEGPRIVIGSSMGGWIALLLARHLAQAGDEVQRACRPRADRAGLRHDRNSDVAQTSASAGATRSSRGRDLCALGLCRALSRSPSS